MSYGSYVDIETCDDEISSVVSFRKVITRAELGWRRGESVEQESRRRASLRRRISVGGVIASPRNGLSRGSLGRDRCVKVHRNFMSPR